MMSLMKIALFCAKTLLDSSVKVVGKLPASLVLVPASLQRISLRTYECFKELNLFKTCPSRQCCFIIHTI